ncbi:hypothetical protein Gotri_026849 [Gossypium trilobum]|uniref:Uncharacterized protein n=1 Tax=Gossypium trilobum TaxID=34281 RepID=A0A7J9FUK3_9ROSI|nr:hypothetical protein [Gossypium trilobum]
MLDDWVDFFKIHSPTHANLVRAFYSNARLEPDESGETVGAINSFLMDTPICLTLEYFGEFFKLPPGAGFKMDPLNGSWVKDYHHNPQDDDDEYLEEDHDGIPPTNLGSKIRTLEEKMAQLPSRFPLLDPPSSPRND